MTGYEITRSPETIESYFGISAEARRSEGEEPGRRTVSTPVGTVGNARMIGMPADPDEGPDWLEALGTPPQDAPPPDAPALEPDRRAALDRAINRALDRSRAIADEHRRQDPQSKAYIAAVNAFCFHAMAAGEYAEAEDTLVEAWKIDRRRITPSDIAAIIYNLGRIQVRRGNGVAIIFLRDAVAIYRKFGGRHRPHLAEALAALAVPQQMHRWTDKVMAGIDEAVAIYRDLAAADASHEPGLAGVLVNRGVLMRRLTEWDRAVESTREGAAIFARLAEGDPDAFAPFHGLALHDLALMLTETGEHAEALAAGRAAAELRGDDLAAHLATLDNLLSAHAAWGPGADAPEIAVKAIKAATDLDGGTPGERTRRLAANLHAVASALDERGHHEAAADVLRVLRVLPEQTG
ncbi:hypothetical protein Afil01_21660 [Actinorhabdospora filicis]|uniref:Tetratricopeptide repeat protein n=1 Tax=Actinorhabdospora filicis TaxID=1785913 RepID=A0A9W6W894_9ACTN|nr:hypothetical protein [Actinorhabdospora filicis]GLZ77359.1 hypothetical protein Afil01_21660 [Actinorhabdospora filicis]